MLTRRAGGILFHLTADPDEVHWELTRIGHMTGDRRQEVDFDRLSPLCGIYGRA